MKKSQLRTIDLFSLGLLGSVPIFAAAVGIWWAASEAAPGSQSPSSRVSGWMHGGGLTQLEIIQLDVEKIASDSDLGQYDTVASDCTQLQSDLSDARGYESIPDSGMQASWVSLLGHLDTAVIDCESDPESMTDSPAMNAAASDTTTLADEADSLG